MRPEDLYLLREVTDCDLHPDGQRVAYTVSWCDESTDSNRSQLWIHDGDSARPLTYGHADSTPRFSPDGRWLAYLSSAHQSLPQLKLLPLDGGEALVLTKADDGVGEPSWLADSSGLVFTAPVRPEHQKGLDRDALVKKPEPRRIGTTQYRFNGRGWIYDRRRHVFAVSIPAAGAPVGEPRQITDGPWDDGSPAPSPDGRTVAFVSARHDDREWTGGSDVWVVPMRGGRPSRRTNGGAWSHVRWLRDGERLLAHGNTERGKVRLATLHVLPAARLGPARRLGDGDVTCGGLLYGGARVAVVGDNVFTYGVRRGAIHVDRYSLESGRRTTVIGGERVIKAFAISRNGRRIVFASGGRNTPSELMDARGSTERVLTDVTAPFLETVALSTIDEFDTVATDGSPVHGFVCRPPATRGRRPGLLYVHGGPLSQYSWGFFDEFQLAAAAGYVVYGANPRGSDGYGQAHADAITGDMGNLDWLDIQAATAALASDPSVDPDRLGIGGGSYGGYMTAWATSHSDRFKAALVERAVTNWVSMEATSDISPFVTMSMGATTVDGLEQMRRQSPITYIDAVRTPTIVLHSEEDWRCPPEQGEQWFAGLRRRGVPAEFVRFPGENHELTRSGRPSLRVTRFRIVHDWFDRYVK
jgi:dipeptidyl aminopeptidase/acylaminoacyl peptidase